MFVDRSTRELRVSSVDSHPVRKSLRGLPGAPHQDDLTAGPGAAGLVALHPQPGVVTPSTSACPDLPGELQRADRYLAQPGEPERERERITLETLTSSGHHWAGRALAWRLTLSRPRSSEPAPSPNIQLAPWPGPQS